MAKKTAVIIGAGPAGLTAAYELVTKTDIKPIILEKSTYMGGISRTVNYKGNRIDIGGHRFFSKSDRVMNWWMNIMPMQKTQDDAHNLAYRGKKKELMGDKNGPDPAEVDRVLLLRNRKSRIYFLRRFFNYPISLSKDTLINLGPWRTTKIGLSYTKSIVFPIKNEKNLEEFFINRFGKELYLTFFKSYTEKVWGVPCNKISAEWGAQRIKGLSIRKAIEHIINKKKENKGISQKEIETSLIEKFLYPKYGPGQMWEEVARIVKAKGGKIITDANVEAIEVKAKKVTGLTLKKPNGKTEKIKGDYFFSTMPVKELINGLNVSVPKEVKRVSEGLVYRDFITVGLLLKKLQIKDKNKKAKLIKDNWIYIQEPDVKVGRLQVFNNWSPYMVANKDTVWVGLEYFCDEGDKLWNLSKEKMTNLAIYELDKIDIIKKEDVLDHTVIKMEKTYPAYFGTYGEFEKIREYLDQFTNLFLIGRNGMHRYNNQDHSMLTAMTAVENIINGEVSKDNIWAVNTEQEYHEESNDSGKSNA